MKNFKVYIVAMVTILLLASCGSAPSDSATGTTTGTTGTSGGGTSTGVSGTLPPTSITVTKSVQTAISATGSALISATVKDSYGAPVANGTTVSFTTDLVGTSVTGTVLTVSGVATATFNANNVAGTATVTASAASISGFVTVDIQPSSPALVALASVSPTQIGVKGSGLPQISALSFSVTDAYGNAVTDGTTVNFSVGAALGGGESITPLSAQTINGQVSVTVTAGSKSGLLGVNATEATTNISTTGSVVIQGGKAIATNFSLDTAKASFEGLDTIGVTNEFTVFVADIFGNPIRTGTAISFMTEVGSIPSATINAAGIATSIFTAPGGDPYTMLKGQPLGAGTGKGGWLTVLAMVAGQEPFTDNNNNGVYDAGDTFNAALHDYGEPFLDANESGAFDVGEPYNDSNGDGAYTAGNGVHDADTILWKSIVVVLSAQNISVATTGGPLGWTITIVDRYNNPVDSSTTYAATLSFIATGSAGTISGNVGSPVPFSVVYNTANPTIPVSIPTFNNATFTSHLAGDTMKITVISPSSTKTIDGL